MCSPLGTPLGSPSSCTMSDVLQPAPCTMCPSTHESCPAVAMPMPDVARRSRTRLMAPLRHVKQGPPLLTHLQCFIGAAPTHTIWDQPLHVHSTP